MKLLVALHGVYNALIALCGSQMKKETHSARLRSRIGTSSDFGVAAAAPTSAHRAWCSPTILVRVCATLIAFCWGNVPAVAVPPDLMGCVAHACTRLRRHGLRAVQSLGTKRKVQVLSSSLASQEICCCTSAVPRYVHAGDAVRTDGRTDGSRLGWSLLFLAAHGITDVCEDEECNTRAQFACQKPRACGHTCHGVRGEATCDVPCLHEGCESKDAVDGEDFCNICW